MTIKTSLNGQIKMFIVADAEFERELLKSGKTFTIEKVNEVIQSFGSPIPEGSIMITFNQEK